MTAEEVDSMAATPAPTSDAAAMIAALVTRFNCVDAEKTWSGSWWTDRLNRDLPDLPRHNIRRQLAGGGSQWLLRWTGYPYANDLARMLCDPVFGLRGTVAHESAGGVDLRRVDATLRLRQI
jgi:hypothetical protein